VTFPSSASQRGSYDFTRVYPRMIYGIGSLWRFMCLRKRSQYIRDRLSLAWVSGLAAFRG
jgi:hypothetical protein